MTEQRTEQAITLMTDFAQRTGLRGETPQRRYLWTDAFALCTLLGLARASGEPLYTELALGLVDRVHHTLGRQRDDAGRKGWLSGLSEDQGEAHPTRGGLRIGKALPERGPEEPFDEQLEWDRDGQYFHYLTKWMHALDQVARFTGRQRFNLWARELARTGCEGFIYIPPGGGLSAMHWKMSIDLTRPLVASMGQHDPLDGYVSCVQLRSTAVRLADAPAAPSLEDETRRFAAMIDGGRLATADPLGIGGLLVDAYRLRQLMEQGVEVDEPLLDAMLVAALAGLEHYARSGELRAPPAYRLPFREFGLAIGLHAVQLMWLTLEQRDAAVGAGIQARLRALMQYASVGDEIESFWGDPEHRRVPTWGEHRDINEVMLATSLAPEGFLVLRWPD